MSLIKKIREKSGYTQFELAKKSGLSLRTIQRLESKNQEPKGYTLTVLSEVFGMEPSALQEKFKNVKQSKASEATSIRLINLSVLSFLGIPFGNIILPFILWRKNRTSKFVDEMGRRIINFQIIFSAVLSILLCISPFIGRYIFSNTSVIFIVLFLAYAVNIIIVCNTAIKLHRNNFNVLNIPLRFI
ncbi:helix-turn-helix domain-containing protein [Psychroserpens sp. AS72]|uniref:helix-turn-helix domain-containing protein n=1 Tax=Psychroserpens sp. AS72 TaxID=3135775 RepID=UPI00317AD615